MAAIAKVTDDNFSAEVTSSEVPVLLDFWAEWCHPCHMIAPELEALAAEQGERLRVGKMNVDESPKTPGKFQVWSIPTLILFVDGEEKARIVGVRKKDAILTEIQPHLAASTTASTTT